MIEVCVPTKSGDRTLLNNLLGCSLSLAIVEYAKSFPGVLLVITPDSLVATKIERELGFFLNEDPPHPNPLLPILLFPDWETLPYDTFSPHQDIISERLTTLYRLPELKRGIVIIPINTLMHRLCPKAYLFQNTLMLKKGNVLDLGEIRERLIQSSYRTVAEVREHGEFSIRGSILDIFPMGSHTPFRIDLFDNEIESIRTFDVDTQRSKDLISEIRLLPAREFPLTETGISHFRTQFRTKFEGDPNRSALYLEVSKKQAAPGLEYYLPLFFEQTNDLFDYLPEKSLIVKIEDVDSAADIFWGEIKERYEQYRHDRIRPILPPKDIFIDPPTLFSAIKKFPQVKFTKKSTAEKEEKKEQKLLIKPLPSIFIEPRLEKPLRQFEAFLHDFQGRVLICVESPGRREVIKELLLGINERPLEVADWQAFLQSDIPFALTLGPLEEGMLITHQQDQKKSISIITEAELLGRRVMQRRRRVVRTFDAEMDMEVKSLAELSVGAPVVHSQYGVGRYLGLTHLVLSEQEAEFVTLEYAGGDKLYVPVSSLHLISRYSGVDIEHAPLHRLGSPEWQRAKQKVMEEARDVAAELLEIYAHREAKCGFSFPKPDDHYEVFSAEFPFEETPDQARAIEEVLKDMISKRPMDRVICGDVGFGKTEVAIRAAFLAIQGGKQVAVLVPTTLLAEQHYQTFKDRFAGFPIQVEVISRFRTRKEQKTICDVLQAGKIDILIGTHKILQEDIQFKTLGLLIIDEEHRFGVRQKEAFKALRSEVDILTLTATPIPRTLNMAMAGIRDLSIIATPPARRLSIKTFVRERSSALIQEAILRELHRGGQVYFVHNVVDTIENEAKSLEKLVPNALVGVAHGQMHERELERVMSDFYHRRFNVLVCTTIIETGIDIPTANTIIIDRADKFGLAQLHQLRGRVGRSHHQAYAFCLLPTHAKVTTDAEKRLEALSNLEELGAGFMLATHDLEIRGAGELLGDSQSGNIQSVGFSLYMELLDQTVKTLRSGGDLKLDVERGNGVEIDLKIPTLIPEAYIPDVHTRLVLYKRISKAKTVEALKDLREEMIDRFGIVPPQTQNLFKTTELRLLAEKLGITKIEAGPKGGRLEFLSKPNVDPHQIIQLIQKKPEHYRLEGPQKLKFWLELNDPESRIKGINQLLLTLKPNS